MAFWPNEEVSPLPGEGSPEDRAEEHAKGDKTLKEPHVKEFDITGRPMRNWVLVGPEGVQDDEQLGAWIRRAVEFVGALPAK